MIRRCQACGAQNRVPVKYLARRGKCGACQAPLPPSSEPVDADPALFEQVLRESEVPVLVDFWAAWCGPCRMVAPEVHKVASTMAGRALVLKVDTEKHPELASRYDVRGIPNFLVLRNGRAVMQQAGAVNHQTLRGWLEQAGAA